LLGVRLVAMAHILYEYDHQTLGCICNQVQYQFVAFEQADIIVASY